MKRAILLALPFLLSPLGCHASVQAHGSASASNQGKDGEELRDYDKPFTPRQGSQTELDGPGGVQYALLGARQDLNFAGTPTETCKCLAVAVGQPNDPRFSWEAAVPLVDGSNQVVVAMTSQSISCPKAKKSSLGASYQGYVTDGTNVMLIVEEARPGRPLTSGGIVPRPASGGALYLRPATKSIPYGSALEGGNLRCRLPTETSTSATVMQVNPNEIFLHPFKAKALKTDDSEEKPGTDGLDALIEPEPQPDLQTDQEPGSMQAAPVPLPEPPPQPEQPPEGS